MDLATRKFIKEFNLFIKQCYHIAWSLEKNTKSKNLSEAKYQFLINKRESTVEKSKNERITFLSKCAVCDSKK